MKFNFSYPLSRCRRWVIISITQKKEQKAVSIWIKGYLFNKENIYMSISHERKIEKPQILVKMLILKCQNPAKYLDRFINRWTNFTKSIY